MSNDNFLVCDRDLTDAALERYLTAAVVAIDTETMGLLPQRDRLCLVQICDPDGYVTVVRIARKQAEAPRLQQLLEVGNIPKVFHFARFDVAQLSYHLDIQVNPIFCTKIASKLARTYTNKHGLKDLVQELEKVELDKSSQSSDWGNANNLSDAQLSYATNDVRYLISARSKLITMLEREERWDLAQKCFQTIPVIVELDLMQYQGIFEH